jgi:hypothetical protein
MQRPSWSDIGDFLMIGTWLLFLVIAVIWLIQSL